MLFMLLLSSGVKNKVKSLSCCLYSVFLNTDLMFYVSRLDFNFLDFKDIRIHKNMLC